MTDNILKKKHVERTAKELVAEIYPADKPYRDVEDKKDVKRGKKYYEAAEHVLNALVAGSTSPTSASPRDVGFRVSAEGPDDLGEKSGLVGISVAQFLQLTAMTIF